MESEFFGHERGAFTGATERREGRFELADGGTLLLDEISEISPKLQAKLLRVLQEREFERVGGTKTIKVDVRVLATTNRDLRQAVTLGQFREDLYYRLNVFPLRVPALRERRADILGLAGHFLERFGRQHRGGVAGFTLEASEALLGYDWPGNVRELKNTIERAVILSENVQAISAELLGLGVRGSEVGGGSFGGGGSEPAVFSGAGARPEGAPSVGGLLRVEPLHAMEKLHILQAIEHTDGNRARAAELLQISIRTLRNKLNEYRMDDSLVHED